ncbi:hypothetical protein Syun_007421 [Stephania yunnanensis]|uniref:Uncharacterized protein n=1 Tax=Stephania yunnanensis TaxID=152371 RepID=A0AAP0PZC4_9MAGN
MSTEIQESSDENKQNGEGEGEGEGGEREREGRQDEEKSVVVADLNSLDPTTIESGIRGNEKVGEELSRSEGESRTFTMRELLNELKEEDPHTHSGDATSPHPPPPPPPLPPPYTYSEDNTQQHYIGHNKVAMELINSVTGVDEEGRSRQRILTFAAKRYANAIERNPEDYDALYNWALVLQESADNVDPDSSFPSKDSLLEEACKKYDEATCLCPTLHDAFYNWAIAISDRAKMRGRTKEAEELWKQALNNWGLALQYVMSCHVNRHVMELSAIVPVREKQNIVKTAISKFRSAIQLQFDFHRAIYNLGTVLYGLAEDTLRTGRPISAKEVSPNELYSQSAIYIAAAHALKPNYSSVVPMSIEVLYDLSDPWSAVFLDSLSFLFLPLPYLKVGYLTAPPAGNHVAPHTDWRRTQFVLNHEGLLNKVEQKKLAQSPSGRLPGPTNTDKSALKIDVPDIVSVSPCADLTLPPGAGICIDTIHGPIFLVADTWESSEGWLDAIRLVYTIFARGKCDVLAGIITS